MASSNPRITQLDGLRGVAIASVFIHHAFRVKLLWMGVDLFFVLSGFLITGILFSGKDRPFGSYIGGFYARRARRILPPYAVLLVITAVIFGVSWLRHWYMYIGAMNFFMPLGVQSPVTLQTLWSLAVEEQFYLLWPLAVYRLSREQLVWCSLALLVLAPILRYVCTPLFSSHWAVYELLLFRMDTLAAGALIALLWPTMRARLECAPKLQWIVAAGCCVISAAALLSVHYLRRHGLTTDSNTPLGNFGVYESTLAIVASVFLMALIGIGKKLLSSWPLIWLGRISYSIYLIHLTALYLAPGHNSSASAIAAAVASVLYATLMWFLVEKPILRGGRTRALAIPVSQLLPVDERLPEL